MATLETAIAIHDELYPEGKRYGNSWRVSSDELCRDFEEDLVIYASGAIEDCGPEDEDGNRAKLRILWLIRRDFEIVNGKLAERDQADWDDDRWVSESRDPTGCTVEKAATWLADWLGEDWEELKRKYGVVARFEKLEEKSEGRALQLTKKQTAAVRAALDNWLGGDIDSGWAFAARYQGRLLYVSAAKSWRRWDGQRWAIAHDTNVTACGKKIAELIFDHAHELSKTLTGEKYKEKRKALYKDGKSLFANISRIQSMIHSASCEQDMFVEDNSVFDQDHWLLNVHNGVIDLKTGRLLDATPDMLISKLAGASYYYDAKCPKFMRFLKEILPDPETRDFIQMALGYTLTGNVRDMVFFFTHGKGDNGKSVLMNIIQAVMGEYAVVVGTELLVKSRNDNEARHQKNLLRGARLALANELARGDIWNTQRLKEITSQEMINAREHHQAAYFFEPTHKLWIRSNPAPGAHDSDDAFWKRMIPIHFDQQIPREKQIADLDKIIIAEELPGVLAWMVEGCLEWQKRGNLKTAAPEGIKVARENYRADTDVIGQWLKDQTVEVEGKEALVKSGEAYKSFEQYCRGMNIGAMSQPQFLRELEGRPGIERSRDTSKRGFYGFKLKTPFDDD
jgi:putative DNA primase/helicase